MSCLSCLTLKKDKLQGMIYILQGMVAIYFSCTFLLSKHSTNL